MDEQGKLECDKHGEQQATFVCQHLVESLRDGRKVGFFDAGEDSERHPRSDAWCSACNEAFEAEGCEWNERSEKNLGVHALCGLCYDYVKAFNLGEVQ